jgi:hypothetical protein
MNATARRLGRWQLAVLLVAQLAGCTAGAPSPTASPSVSQTPSGTPGPSSTAPPSATPIPSPPPTGGTLTVTSFAQAAALVLASDPRFSGVGPQQFDVIGQCCWYDSVEVADGWEVTVEIGWGDCPAGCINRHRWRFHVDHAGSVEPLSEEGAAPVPVPVPGSGPASATVRLVAGPSCPVVVEPPDPECVARPLIGAEVIVRAPDGTELARAVSDQDGQIELIVEPGTFWLEPQPVEGLLGTAAPIAFALGAGDEAFYTLFYDTGIR